MTVKNIFDVVSPMLQIVATGVMTFMELFTGLSIALFIMDGFKAKKQGRKRKAVFTVMLIISIIYNVLMFLLGIYAASVIFMFMTGKAWR